MSAEVVETVKDCHHPWTWMMVSADGNVKPCCWAPGNLGNLYESSPEEIWNGPLAQDLRQSILDNKVHSICARSPCKYVQNAFAQSPSDIEPGSPEPKVIPITSNPLVVTPHDVVAAYKLFLNRLPENKNVIEQRLGNSPITMLKEFLLSPEFRRRRDLDTVILALAADILKRQKKVQQEQLKSGKENGV